jgi:hypothetical protein
MQLNEKKTILRNKKILERTSDERKESNVAEARLSNNIRGCKTWINAAQSFVKVIKTLL